MTILASLGFFTLLLIGIVMFIIITALVENEKGSFATGFILAVAGLLYWAGGHATFLNFLNFVTEHTVSFVLIVVGYLVAGVVYSFAKWYLYVKEEKRRRHDMPEAGRHKATLIRWIAYWIFSIWWTLLDEPLKALVDYLGKSYDRVAKKIYDAA